MRNYTLSNGMKVVISSVNIQEIISIGLFFRVGSQNETACTNGITHLLEHVISSHFLSDCSKIGGRSNALTTREYCCFFSKCMNRQFEEILGCCRRICDKMYSEADVLHAQKIVLNEIQALDTEQALDQQILQTHLGEDPLHFLPIGTSDNIKSLTPYDIDLHFNNYIRPTNCVLSIVGCIDEAKGIQMVERNFSDWLLTAAPVEQNTPIFLSSPKEQRLLISDSKTTSLRILFDGVSRTSENKAAYSLICNLLGGGTHSVLFKQIREKQFLAYNAFCMPQFFSRRGIVFLKVVGISGKSTTIVESISSLMLALTRDEIPLEDIERCKKSLIEDYIFKHETLSSKMTLCGQQLLLDGYISSDRDIIEAINKVDLEDIKIGLNGILSGNITLLLDSSVERGLRYF